MHSIALATERKTRIYKSCRTWSSCHDMHIQWDENEVCCTSWSRGQDTHLHTLRAWHACIYPGRMAHVDTTWQVHGQTLTYLLHQTHTHKLNQPYIHEDCPRRLYYIHMKQYSYSYKTLVISTFLQSSISTFLQSSLSENSVWWCVSRGYSRGCKQQETSRVKHEKWKHFMSHLERDKWHLSSDVWCDKWVTSHVKQQKVANKSCHTLKKTSGNKSCHNLKKRSGMQSQMVCLHIGHFTHLVYWHFTHLIYWHFTHPIYWHFTHLIYWQMVCLHIGHFTHLIYWHAFQTPYLLTHLIYWHVFARSLGKNLKW